MKRVILWIGALVIGTIIGLIENEIINDSANFVATIYTQLFQLLAVPTIVLAVTTTLATLGNGDSSATDSHHNSETGLKAGRIFRHTITYTLLTSFAAAAVGLVLYLVIAPGNIPLTGDFLSTTVGEASNEDTLSYSEHILNIIPNNIVRPFLEGNVLSLLLLASAFGYALSRMPETKQKQTVIQFLQGLQDLLFILIRGLIFILPLGIVAFAAQLAAQLNAGIVADSLGKYTAVVLAGNLLQFFVVLPLFLLLRGINPIRTFSNMTPAILMALFTKSSAATLPVTIESAERRLGVNPRISRFLLPICTTINMNGCAAFILVTSLFVMQQGGIPITWITMITWLVISVISAIGNAGVPMGCYFLTLSLMTGIGAPIAVLGLILPIYTIIDMVETAVNVWSDSCVCAMTDHDLK